MTLTKWAAIVGVTSSLAGCATTADGRDGWRAIRPSAADVDVDRMSDELVRQLLAHNLFGQSACGWRA